MTTHSLNCTHCGYRIQSDNLDELISVKRSCMVCGHSSWEVRENDSYPCTERERKILYQKILHLAKWCIKEKPCKNNGYCPLLKFCNGENHGEAFIHWIMETEL